MQEFKLYKSPGRAKRLILGCSVFVIIGFWQLESEHTPLWMAYSSICFFGLGVIVGLFHLLDDRPQIVINEVGIFDRMGQKEMINWEIIKDAYLLNISGQPFICVVVDEKFKPSKKKGSFYRKVANLSEFIGAQEINISLGQLNVDYQKLTDFILQMRSATKSDKNDMLKSIVE
jgi:hypothetical protein